MASKIRVVLNHGQVRALLRSQEMLAVVKAEAQAMADIAGPGFEVSAVLGENRARASVITATVDAQLSEARDRTLTKALGQRAR